jgi:hypothetical protein
VLSFVFVVARLYAKGFDFEIKAQARIAKVGIFRGCSKVLKGKSVAISLADRKDVFILRI